MESNTITKRQAAGIISEELSTQYLGLQILSFIVILQTIALAVTPQFTLLLALFFGLLEAVIIYSIYKKTSAKIKELNKKYGEQ